MSKKNSNSNRKTNIIERLKNNLIKIKKIVAQEQQKTEETYGKITNKFYNTMKVFIASGKKFIEDDCLTKASAIAYTTLISLIPTLTVALTISYWLNKEKNDLFINIQKFLIEQNLQRLNITPILDAISGLIDNAASIGGIGIIVLIFSATSILRTLENSLNSIWKITKQRPMHLKMIYYWAALTLGPIMIITGTTVAKQFSDIISESDYYSMAVTHDKLWMVGTKANIMISETSGIHSAIDEILSSLNFEDIDFTNQKNYNLDQISNSFTPTDYEIDKLELEKASFTDIVFKNDLGIITAKKGLMLRTVNGGRKWSILRLGYLDLLKIEMTDENIGYIITEKGYFLSTNDGGLTWKIYNFDRNDIQFTDMSISANRIFITATGGLIFQSFDSGLTWNEKKINSSRYKKSYSNLNSISMYDFNNGIIVGDDGLILKTSNGGRTWDNIKFRTYDYFAVMMRTSKNIYIGGEKGVFLHSIDGGKSWQYYNFKTQAINSLYYLENKLWAIGDSGMIMYSENEGISWEGTKGTSLIMYILNFLAPFFFIWVLFLLMYTAFPNIHVPFKAAALGASFTASVWVAFTLIFIYYVKALANTTFAIYGALAAVPLFLLIVYFSTLIILFGAEVAYSLMYPETYLKLNQKKKKSDDIRIINGIRILYTIYKKFELGKGFTSYKELLKTCGERIPETDYFLYVLEKYNYITENDRGQYLPTNSSQNIKISTVIDTIYDTNLELYSTTSDVVRKKLTEKFKKMNEARKEILGEETLYDLINNQ